MSQYSVLIVEDDSQASYTLEQTINQHPLFRVVAAAESVTEAQQLLSLQPDLVFLDISLPDGSGMTFLREIRQLDLNTAVIITTAERDSATVAQAIQFGVNDYLVKPLRLSRVHQALDDLADFRSQLGSASQVDQLQIDELMRKNRSQEKQRSTPKGIDANTLQRLIDDIQQRRAPFSAQEIGDQLELSRITARRYLEYLEQQGMVRMTLDYNTGGRPKQLYHLTPSN
ncbi:response regulator [Oceanobacter mangrovi]|uniref:response regulator n=1 Tax=Oceanobacter mangrovi TaxID=2862510 RepID=UPI001C8E5FBC|nr:response regulator [Oceanobacter mangrovi]